MDYDVGVVKRRRFLPPSLSHFHMPSGYTPDNVLRTPTNMTDDSEGSFVTSQSSTFNSDPAAFGAWLAFDGNAATMAHSADGLPWWIKIDLGSAQYCASYKVTARDNGQHAWADWVLEGSPDDSSWTTVDTRSGQTFAAGEEKTYNVGTPQQFRYWRWTVSATTSTFSNVAALKIYS